MAVAELGSFSQAALALGVSQPTVSQRVQSLEGLYGLRLFDRRHGVNLTPAGREIFKRARLLLSRAEELDHLARDLGALRQGRLSLGYSTPSFAMPLIAALLEEHPHLAVEHALGNTADLLEEVRQCRLDVAVLTLDWVPSDLRVHRIARQVPMACTPAAHRWATRDAITLSELAEELVLLREPGSMTRSLFEAACSEGKACLKSTVTLPSREAVKEAVAAGIGVGIVLAGEVGADPRIKALDLAGADAEGGVYAVSLPETSGLPALEAFFNVC